MVRRRTTTAAMVMLMTTKAATAITRTTTMRKRRRKTTMKISCTECTYTCCCSMVIALDELGSRSRPRDRQTVSNLVLLFLRGFYAADIGLGTSSQMA